MLLQKPARSLLVLAPLLIISILTNGILPARASNFQLHSPIVIDGNGGFTTANGVKGGSGTATDPYVIEGWEIASPPSYGILVVDTNAHFVIRDVYVHSAPPFSDFVGVVEFEDVVNGGIENVTLSNNSRFAAIHVRYSNNITISHNRIESNEAYAIGVEFPQNVTITSNLIRSNLGGIFVSGVGTSYAEIVGNEVSSNKYCGIAMASSSNVVSGNSVNSNGCGISAGRRCDCFIMGNTISNNYLGIGINSGPSPFHNNFINNTVQASAGCPYAGCVWTWDRGYPNGGNFWSDNVGVDNCSGSFQNVCPSPDGIGDTPYNMNFDPPRILSNTDRFPLMKPFAPAVSGTVSLGPATIGAQSNGGYLTAIVKLPEGYNASNLIPSSIRLNGSIALASGATVSQSNGAGLLVVRFNMTQVRALLSKPSNYALQVSGNLLTSTNFRPFYATASVRLLPQ